MIHIDETWYTRHENLPDRTGAGGVVYRFEDDLLLIALAKEHVFGDDQYTIPKGGVEDDEDLLQAAAREIAEETGLTELIHRGNIGALARCNYRKTWWQVSHYFLYRTEQIEGTPTDPDNYGLTWFSPDALPPMVWPDEARLLRNYDWEKILP